MLDKDFIAKIRQVFKDDLSAHRLPPTEDEIMADFDTAVSHAEQTHPFNPPFKRSTMRSQTADTMSRFGIQVHARLDESITGTSFSTVPALSETRSFQGLLAGTGIHPSKTYSPIF